ncbi:hypothetical protein D3C80_1357810 [compost metagenome]
MRFRLHLAHKTERQADLRVGYRRSQTRFAQQSMPGLHILIATINDADLPDQQYLRGILQMGLIRTLKIADKLIACGFTKLVNHRFQRHRRDTQTFT